MRWHVTQPIHAGPLIGRVRPCHAVTAAEYRTVDVAARRPAWMTEAPCCPPTVRGALEASVGSRRGFDTVEPMIIRARSLPGALWSRRLRYELRTAERKEHLFDEPLELCAYLRVKP